MNIQLIRARKEDAELVHRLQVAAFMPLYEKYHDDATSPAKETLEKIIWKIEDVNGAFYLIYCDNTPIGGIRVRNHNGEKVEKYVNWISPIFIVSEFQNQGIASLVINKIFDLYPDTITWRLGTIKEEKGNCYLYEKLGFVRFGDEEIVNECLTLIKYEKNCVNSRRLEPEDADKVSNIITRNFLEINVKDYGIEKMKQAAAEYNADKVLQIASYAHSYVFEVNNEIIACGSISSFWGSETESILLTIFVKPELHGMGVGRRIIETLESDELFRRATRVEIPASITGTEFYRKFGYDYKNGIKELDEEGHYRLEKFKEATL